MNAKLSRQMTLLGVCAMAFYGVMLATGMLSVEVMPQFVVSAVIFLSSGRVMRAAARSMARDAEERERPSRPEPDWPWLTALLNWTAVCLVVGIMAILLMKPLGVSLSEALQFTQAPEQYFAHTVP